MPASVTSDVDVADGGSYFHAVRVPVSYLGCANKGIPLMNIHYLQNIWMSRLFGLHFFSLFSRKKFIVGLFCCWTFENCEQNLSKDNFI